MNDTVASASSAARALRHRIPVPSPTGGPPVTYTVDLAYDEDGDVLVTCRELPEVATFGHGEAAALIMAEMAIQEALAARQARARKD